MRSASLFEIENDFHIQIIAHIEALVKPVLQKKNSN